MIFIFDFLKFLLLKILWTTFTLVFFYQSVYVYFLFRKQLDEERELRKQRIEDQVKLLRKQEEEVRKQELKLRKQKERELQLRVGIMSTYAYN